MNKKRLKIKIAKFPKTTGVYLMKNAAGKVIYVGKATSLRDRVSSYFARPHDQRIENLVAEIADIDYQKTPTVIEAMILEANLIKKYLPKYNIKEKDDKSFLYVTFTQEKFPRLIPVRGNEVERIQNSKNKKLIKNGPRQTAKESLITINTRPRTYCYGPFTSASSLRAALDILRKIFPYRDCSTFPKRPCLQYHLKRCSAPCVGLISGPDYRKNIKNLIMFFEGKKEKIIKNLKKQMAVASKKENFELAAKLRNQIFSLKHIQDVAVIKNEKPRTVKEKNGINIFGRIEGYDISNINGTSATGSMVVFTDGKPNKNEYRKFRIKTLTAPNDVGMMKEIMERRLKYLKPSQKQLASRRKSGKTDLAFTRTPDLILVDGGWGQINAIREVLVQKKLKIPVLGIAKGFDRKQNRLIVDKDNLELIRIAAVHKDLLLRIRDEAHRFAQSYHKFLRKKKLLGE